MPGHTDGSASTQRVTKQTQKGGDVEKIVRKGFRRMGRLVMKGGRRNYQHITYI